MQVVHNIFDELFSLENIFEAWEKFRRGKSRKKDVMDFESHLEDNLFGLWEDLHSGSYKHSSYEYFQIFDNKKRDIYKAKVRDRIVHQIIYDHLIFLWEKDFISDSYASRKNKGQYKAVGAFRYFIKLILSDGNGCFVLKCDVRKYFDSIDHGVLLCLIAEKILCKKTFAITREIIESYVFSSCGKGVPLGNITSQVFANIYLDVLDEYIKKGLKCRFYVRYNDDFLILSRSRRKLETVRNEIIDFCKKKLLLDIPSEKTGIRKIGWGVDFLGFVILPKAVLLRDKTKSKMYANINSRNISSYFGILNHCNSRNLKKKTLSMCMEKFEKIC